VNRIPCMKLFALMLGLSISSTFAAETAASCPPAGYDKPALQQLRQSGFEVAEDAKRNSLALALMDCVANPDPELRDGMAFEGIANWLRAEKLSSETYQSLFAALMLQLQAAPDSAGFRQPFAALILSEVARVDRLQGWLSPDQRDQLVQAAAEYLRGVRDYRGFSETEGWRHGVAHGADLALQLVLNDNINSSQIELLLEAVAAQVAPAGEIFYIYGEPMRLARVANYAHQRDAVPNEFWEGWFKGIVQASPLQDWSEAFGSQLGLARRHNTLAFLLAMHLNATAAEDEQSKALDQWVMQALTQLP